MFGHIFPASTLSQGASEKSLNITKTDPVLLSEIIVTALSEEAYRVACSHGSPLEAWLAEESRILRQGTTITFASDPIKANGHGSSVPHRSYQYRLDMTEPVLQGYAMKGSTRFYITRTEQLGEGVSMKRHISPDVGEESGSDPDGIEINESFLAGSVLHTRQNATHPAFRESILTPYNDYSRVDGDPEKQASHSDLRLYAMPLSEPISKFHDDYTVYLRTSELSRLGILNGDWVSLMKSEHFYKN